MVAEINVDALVDITTPEDISRLAQTLKTSHNRNLLAESIAREGLVFYKEDQYSKQFLKELEFDETLLGNILINGMRDTRQVRLLHVLQLIGFLNPFLEHPIQWLIKQFTV